MKRRYLIIGSGVAGIAAAENIRAIDPQGEIRVITEDLHGYYSRPGLAYYLTGEMGEEMLYPYPPKKMKELNLHWQQGFVRKIEAQAHRVQMSDLSWLAYDRLLLATGSMAAPLNLPGEQLGGVFKLDNLHDARQIIHYCRRARTAVVVGGGITALELVEGLRAHGVRVNYLLRGERYWNNVLDEIESRIIEQRLVREGVNIHFHTEVAEIMGHNQRVSGVRTKTGEIIRCDLVAGAIGVLPRVELARVSGLPVERGVLTDERMQTGQSDVFAAGDVAEAYDPISKRRVLDTLWGPAREQGAVAGSNMAGISSIFYKKIAYNVTRLAGLTTTIIGTVGRGADQNLMGIARGDSETWRMLPDSMVAESSFEVNRLRVLVGENNLIGAIVMGD
jgi:NAD(P)H-nitrite reductase large subunit